MDADIQKLTKLPLLSAKETASLCREAQCGCLQSRNVLIERNMRLVLKIAKKFAAWKRIDVRDCIQQSVIGLITAIGTYNPDRGTWPAHAWRHITNKLYDVVRMEQLIWIPEYQNRREKPHADDAARARNIFREDTDFLGKVEAHTEEPIDYESLYRGIQRLPKEQRRVITALYLEDGDQRYRSIGRRYGCSGEWIRTLKNRALMRLRNTVDTD